MTKDVGQPFGDRVIVVVATPVASISVSPVTLTRRDGRRMDGDWMVVGWWLERTGRKDPEPETTKNYGGEWDEIGTRPAICGWHWIDF